MSRTKEEILELLTNESPRFIKKCLAQAEFLITSNKGKYKTKWEAIDESYNIFNEWRNFQDD